MNFSSVRIAIGTALLATTPLAAHFAFQGNSAHQTQTVHTQSSTRGTYKVSGSRKLSSRVPLDLREAEDLKRRAVKASADQLEGEICNFLRLYDGGEKQSKAGTYCPNVPQSKVNVMIAILPDPVHTHLALRFDRGIDDLENISQKLGWGFAKAWLPWSNQPDFESHHFEETVEEETIERGWQNQPGVLLFRPTTPVSEEHSLAPLVVLLVGDTPTSGVNAEQFRNAFAIRKLLTNGIPSPSACRTSKDCMSVSPLTIFGPTFTGSVSSLKRLLEEQFPPPKKTVACIEKNASKVLVASGTVSDYVPLADLVKDWCDGTVRAVTFAADMLYTRSHLLRFIDTHLQNRRQVVAELTEEESDFGASSSETDNILLDLEDRLRTLSLQRQALQKKLSSRRCQQPNSDAKAADARYEERERLLTAEKAREEAYIEWLKTFRQGLGENYDPRLIEMKFPREISLLRRAYEQNAVAGFGVAPDDKQQTQLRFNFLEDTRDDDAVASFSGTQGALSMEARIAQIAATLAQQKVAVAIIRATDVLDEIFVARYLEQHAPSVTLIIQDADLLFLRGGNDASLNGVYVVSPYPLIPQNGFWSADANRPHGTTLPLSASQGDTGMENAAEFLLCGGPADGVNRPAKCSRHEVLLQGDAFHTKDPKWRSWPMFLQLPQYQAPFAVEANVENDFKLQPPLWLSVIGHGGFQPVSLIDLDSEWSRLPESSELTMPRLGILPPQPGSNAEVNVDATMPRGIYLQTPLQVRFACLVLVVLLALHLQACCVCRLDRGFAWSYAPADPEQWGMRLGAQLSLTVFGILALGSLLLPDAPGLHIESPSFIHLLKALQWIVAFIAVAAAWRMGRACQVGWRRHAGAFIALCFTVGGVLFSHYFLGFVAPDGRERWTERAFFFFRSAYLLNGASPALPFILLLGALSTWVFGLFGKMMFAGSRVPRLPNTGEDLRCPPEKWMLRLNRLLSEPVYSFRSGLKWRARWNSAPAKTLLIAGVCVTLTLLLSGTRAENAWPGEWGPRSLAQGRFDSMIDFLVFIVAVAITQNLTIAVSAWLMLRDSLLVPLKQSPLRWGFSWVRGFSWKRLWTSPRGFSPEAQLDFVMRNVEQDRRSEGGSEIKRAYQALADKYEEAREKKYAYPLTGELVFSLGALYEKLADEASTKITWLRAEWQQQHGPLTGPDRRRGYGNEIEPKDAIDEDSRRRQLERMGAEEFVALVYLSYISSALIQIRNRVVTAAAMYVPLLWAMTSYPWMNRHAILLELCALLAGIAGVAIFIFAQMQRDDILSRTTETEPGKLDRSFFVKILAVLGIPLLTLIASQFPEFHNLIFSWLEPSLSSMR